MKKMTRKFTLFLILLSFFCMGMALRPPKTDSIPPQISISAPANNSIVSGTVDIQVQATDNKAVTKVKFYVDSALKSTDTASPYTYSWATATATNATHTLKAIAYDAKNNSAQAQVSVKVDNTAPSPPPPPPTTPPPSSDSELAISSASASSSSTAVTRAIDKNLSTYWQGAWRRSFFSRYSNWWLTLDLGKTYSLTQISIFWHSAYGSTNYFLQGSTNKANWVNLATALSSAGANSNPYQKDHTLSGSYRYIRIFIAAARRKYPIIYEVRLYGESSSDTTPPTGSIKINNDAQYTNSTTVTLNLSAQDNAGGRGLSQMSFSDNNSTWSSPETYAVTKAWILPAGDGVKTVYVKFSDKAGNWSIGYSDSIILDTQPPTLTISSPQEGEVIK